MNRNQREKKSDVPSEVRIFLAPRLGEVDTDGAFDSTGEGATGAAAGGCTGDVTAVAGDQRLAEPSITAAVDGASTGAFEGVTVGVGLVTTVVVVHW